ncbi:MAG TPA: N-methyl-L-tryptophan oxidase [Rhizomicrobium sp.]|nr:N-methyl-L-tryptophan oxidase [Rhizomicrobium sp.]
MKYDVIVLGFGAMGSAAAYQLAKRGARVLGIDRYAPPHTQGSSHGGSRVTRLAIGEGEHLTPFVKRSHEIWRDIEYQTGANLLCTNGGLIISSNANPASTHVKGFFQNTVDAARKHNIAHERLDAAEIRRRYPMFNVRDDEFGYFEPSAGFVRPEACVHAQLELAKKHEAVLRTGETAVDFASSPEGVDVITDKGKYHAKKLIIAAGAWAPELLGPQFSRLFKIYRQVLLWFQPRDGVAAYRPDRFPIFIWELPDAQQGIYGFPAIDGATGGIKIASESFAETTDPKSVWRKVSPDEIAAVHERYVAPFFPDITPVCVRSAACLYTVTPDSGFIIDTHPVSDRIMIASPCSGHGFKHSAAIGEALADWALGGESRHDLSAFGLARFVGR